MVVLPYKDRLLLFSRYLQQLVMESIGKEKDLAGRVVHQGLAVYGNKGSTDQHAFVQQLRDGTPDFFVSFVRVLRDREGASLEVEPGATSGDFLDGLLLGTRRALHESGRPSLTITVRELDARSLGMLIALYERAVGLYASLVGINAYHQPGVEAGKKAAAVVLELQRKVLAVLAERGAAGATCEELAAAAGAPDEVETVFHLLERLSANPERGVTRRPGPTPFDATYTLRGQVLSHSCHSRQERENLRLVQGGPMQRIAPLAVSAYCSRPPLCLPRCRRRKSATSRATRSSRASSPGTPRPRASGRA